MAKEGSGINCPKCEGSTKVIDTVNMGVIIWRNRACLDLKCGKVFYTREKRDDLEAFAQTIVDSIVTHELLTHSNKISSDKVRVWEQIVRRVLKDYRDE